MYELSDGCLDSEDEDCKRPWNILKVALAYLNCLNIDELCMIKNHIMSQKIYGLLYFDVIIRGQRLKAMLDSGSSRDIIDAGVQRRLGLKATRIPEYSLGLADDTHIVCNSETSVVMKFVSKNKSPFKDCLNLSILDLKGKFDVILGQPFLVRRNPHIDWRSKCMTFSNNHSVYAYGQRQKVTSIRQCEGNAPTIAEHGPTINDNESNPSILSSDVDMHDQDYDHASQHSGSNHDINMSDDHVYDNESSHEPHADSSTPSHERQRMGGAPSVAKVNDTIALQEKFLQGDLTDSDEEDSDASAFSTPDDVDNLVKGVCNMIDSSAPKDDVAEIISASAMRDHLKQLTAKFPEMQCAICVLNVPSTDMVKADTLLDQAMDNDNAIATYTMDIPDDLRASDWICNVEDGNQSDANQRRLKRLEKLRKKVMDRFSKAKMADGTPLMSNELPPGIPPVRFKKDGQLNIETDPEAPPPASGQIPLSVDQLKELRKQMEYYVPRGFWEPSSSPYAAPILFAPKMADDGSFDGWKLCVDYRKLNQITQQDKFPLPNPETLIAQLAGAKYFSKLDLTQFFHQIPVNPKDVPKTAMVSRYGSYQWTVMPFGLVNAPATSVRFGAKVFDDFLDKFMVIFIDDVLVYSKTAEEHLMHLEQILQRLLKYKLYVKPKKCTFFAASVS